MAYTDEDHKRFMKKRDAQCKAIAFVMLMACLTSLLLLVLLVLLVIKAFFWIIF